jgi:hypothetical protein
MHCPATTRFPNEVTTLAASVSGQFPGYTTPHKHLHPIGNYHQLFGAFFHPKAELAVGFLTLHGFRSSHDVAPLSHHDPNATYWLKELVEGKETGRNNVPMLATLSKFKNFGNFGAFFHP